MPKSFPLMGEEPAENIKAVARWAEFAEDATWHTRVGEVLYDAGYHSNSISEFQAAIELDPRLWRARSGLAWVYSEQGRWAEAIDTMEKCLEIFEEDENIMTQEREKYIWCLSWLSTWRIILGEKPEALKSYEQAFELSPRDYSLATWVFRILTEMKEYEKVMSRLVEMKHDIIPSLGYSRLTEMCIFWANNNIDPFAGITAAARATNNLDMIRDLLSYSVKIARRHAKTTASLALQMNLGLLLFREYDDEPNGIGLWRSVLENSGFAKPGSPSYRVRYKAAEELCRVYADRAVFATPDSSEFATAVERLEDLLKMLNKKNQRCRTLGQNSEEWGHGATQAVMLTLGMLYRLSGRNTEAHDMFAPHVRLGIDLLSDDDPENDWIAYSKLSKVFIHAGDETNFQAALTATPKWVQCDGICGLGVTTAVGFSSCKFCINMDFCENCLTLLKKDELPAKRCSPKHQFFRYRTPETPLPRGIILMGEEEMTVKEWLWTIKRAWGLQ
jgi:tetratricopeptide (TPR) repeat protein